MKAVPILTFVLTMLTINEDCPTSGCENAVPYPGRSCFHCDEDSLATPKEGDTTSRNTNADVQKIMWCTARRVTTEITWRMIRHLNTGLGILIVCTNIQQRRRYSEYLTSQRVTHVVLEDSASLRGEETHSGQSRDERSRMDSWLRFQKGEYELCLTTQRATKLLLFTRQILVVYTSCPSSSSASRNLIKSNTLLLIYDNIERLGTWFEGKPSEVRFLPVEF
jgi:hypothetical protein